MSLVINHNLMAMNSARNLSNHYSQLSVSTRRLSSGLRIGTAADDAAGLAIRELMRADIASLNQGMRNANDAVSLIQTADGALQIIDEKLIRMKELAEQAATGTYSSDQRLIIDSEYQAMASEITRIAMATDFNGISLLNGNLESSIHDGSGVNSDGKLKVHFGTGNSSAEDYYYIQIGCCTSAALGLGTGKNVSFAINKTGNLAYDFAANWYLERFGDEASKSVGKVAQNYSEQFFNIATNYQNHTPYNANPSQWDNLSSAEKEELKRMWGNAAANSLLANGQDGVPGTVAPNDRFINTLIGSNRLWSSLVEADPNLANTDASGRRYYNILATDLAGHIANTYEQYSNTNGITISSQESAQLALNAINNAIISKDKIRANLGAMQNRLENTISNLSIQAENLQAAESRISDVDVAAEMTEFVREQILTQAAVAMLAQANSLPKLAMQLIGG